MSEDDWLTIRKADLAEILTKAITPLYTENVVVKDICQQAIDLARDRTNVLEVVAAQNVLARMALQRLLNDNEHAKHNCGDSPEDCPVAFARYVLRGPVKQ